MPRGGRRGEARRAPAGCSRVTRQLCKGGKGLRLPLSLMSSSSERLYLVQGTSPLQHITAWFLTPSLLQAPPGAVAQKAWGCARLINFFLAKLQVHCSASSNSHGVLKQMKLHNTGKQDLVFL